MISWPLPMANVHVCRFCLDARYNEYWRIILRYFLGYSMLSVTMTPPSFRCGMMSLAYSMTFSLSASIRTKSNLAFLGRPFRTFPISSFLILMNRDTPARLKLRMARSIFFVFLSIVVILGVLWCVRMASAIHKVEYPVDVPSSSALLALIPTIRE